MKKNYIARGIKYLQHHNMKSLIVKMQERIYRDRLERDYDTWARERQTALEELEKQRAYQFEKISTFSIVVPLYNTPEKFLREMIKSVQCQSYPHWELCLADGSTESLTGEIVEEYQKKDSRIKYKKLTENKGISENTNEALNMAEGDFIALFDHDDLLEPDVLFEVMKVLEEKPNTDIIYTDEDKIDGESGTLFGANFKPDFDLELLRTNNYICHFFVVGRNIVERVGGFRSEFDGAQDYDFIFRCVEATMEIYHIRKVLYHWRTHAASTAASPESKMYAYEAAKRAIEAHFNRMEIKAEVGTTQNYGFFNYNLQGISKEKIKVLSYGKEDNGEALNKLAESAKAEVLVFVPKDMEVKTIDYESILAAKCIQRGTGAVGCLQIKGGKVKEAGLILEKERIAVPYFEGYRQSRTGYFHRLSLSRTVSAVSGVFAIEKDLLRTMEGFLPKLGAKAAQIELCIRMQETG
ncbi:MAG: glycosyltransferase, partial [Lachnospiraceae bacterium]|nr:glycosyltransferase [Lachnospiraceae bacterium]